MGTWPPNTTKSLTVKSKIPAFTPSSHWNKSSGVLAIGWSLYKTSTKSISMHVVSNTLKTSTLYVPEFGAVTVNVLSSIVLGPCDTPLKNHW